VFEKNNMMTTSITFFDAFVAKKNDNFFFISFGPFGRVH
jgi:hypothetical protein